MVLQTHVTADGATTCRRDWRRLMEREGVDVWLPQTATPEQTTWFRETRVPVRSIVFELDETLGHDSILKLEASAFTSSTDLLATSTRTLEVCTANLPGLVGDDLVENSGKQFAAATRI